MFGKLKDEFVAQYPRWKVKNDGEAYAMRRFVRKTFGDLDRFDELSGWNRRGAKIEAIFLVAPRADVFRHIPLFERLAFLLYLYKAINAQTTDTQPTLVGVPFYDLLSQSTPCDEHFKVFLFFCFEDDKVNLNSPLSSRWEAGIIKL